MIQEFHIIIPQRLLHVDMFSQIPMKKSTVDVELVSYPHIRDGKREKNPNGGGFENRWIKLNASKKIFTTYLMEPLGNQVGFISIHWTIDIAFGLKNLLRTNNIYGWSWKDEMPSLTA